MSFSENQQALIAGLSKLGVDKETAFLVMLRMDTDKKADNLLDWLVENQEGLTENKLLRKALEIGKDE